MGELYKQARGLDKTPSPPEMVTVVLTLSKPAWAALKMKVELGATDGINRQIHQALESAIVMDSTKADMVSFVAGIADSYDVDKATRKLKEFFEGTDEDEPASDL